MLTDALGIPIGFPAHHEGSSFGAALLGMDALGLISLERAADLIRIQETLAPDQAAQQTYADLRPTFDGLYDALVPAFRTLRQMRPDLPLA
jgi:gluconokinase